MIQKITRHVRLLMYKLRGNDEAMHSLRLEDMRKKGLVYGTNFRCFSNINSSEPYLIEVGDNVTISTDVKFITHDNSIIKLNCNGTDVFGKIKIKNNCFIGSGAIILPGVFLDENIIVGAGSVVTKSFKEKNIVIAGNPAKKICSAKSLEEKLEIFGHDMRGLNFEQRKSYLLNIREEKFIQK